MSDRIAAAAGGVAAAGQSVAASDGAPATPIGQAAAALAGSAGTPAVAHRWVASRLLVDHDNVDPALRSTLVLVDPDSGRQAVLIELRLDAGADVDEVRERFMRTLSSALPDVADPVQISVPYMRCLLTPDEIEALLDADERSGARTVFHVWPDYILRPHLDRSVATVKADAASRAYGAAGAGVVWAVLDSGIDPAHPHFCGGDPTDPRPGWTVRDPVVASLHRDFTYLVRNEDGPKAFDPDDALRDPYGHGTHVAGIIAGALPAATSPSIAVQQRTVDQLPSWGQRSLPPGCTLAGIAPRARLVSLRVLDGGASAGGESVTVSSAVIAALEYVRRVNSGGRLLRIHGVNLSLGCQWYPDEFAAGQSPLCRELDLLVRTGVVAVVSAGNLGAAGSLNGGSDPHGSLSTITDPGNSAAAITVGSTHRDEPHTYGVSYTSSKGPTLDGRLKPDLVAPGEHITSAATGSFRAGVPPLQDAVGSAACYRDASGTSMAAPHVSGAIAAFLSVRPEYVGRTEEVKRLFVSYATSLGRHEFYQGAGLVDLMRVLSNV